MKERVNGFVLAGGKSSRMGSDKGLMDFKGKSLISYSIEALLPICHSVTIISNNPRYGDLEYSLQEDLIKNKGPLAGIYTGLVCSETEKNIFLSCDTPFLSSSLLSYLIDQSTNYDAVIPFHQHQAHPLIALYTKNCQRIFKERIQQNKLKVKDAIELVKTNKVDLSSELPFFDERMLSNINTKKELEHHAN